MDILLDYSPYLIMVLSLLVFSMLLFLGIKRKAWEYYSVSVIPLLLFFIYLYIALHAPDFSQSKYVLRSYFIFSLCNGIVTVLSKMRRHTRKDEYPYKNKRGNAINGYNK